MKLKIELFAGAREAMAGCGTLKLSVPPGSTVADVLVAIADQHPPLSGLAGRSRLAIDDRYADPGDLVDQGQTLALIPPVSGG